MVWERCEQIIIEYPQFMQNKADEGFHVFNTTHSIVRMIIVAFMMPLLSTLRGQVGLLLCVVDDERWANCSMLEYDDEEEYAYDAIFFQ
jgi:hypothetical protein